MTLRRPFLALLAAAVLVCAAAGAQPEPQQIAFVQQGLEESRYSFNAGLTVPVGAQPTIRIVFDYKDPQTHCALVLAGGTAQFQLVQDGKPTNIGLPGKAALTPGEHTVTLQRRLWRMSCILDNVVVASAYDSTLSGGDVGYEASGVQLNDPFVQAVSATLEETDDFMRTGKEGNPWRGVSGSWEYKRLRVEDPQKQDDVRAANAFSYFGSDEGVALAVYGLPDQQGFYPTGSGMTTPSRAPCAPRAPPSAPSSFSRGRRTTCSSAGPRASSPTAARSSSSPWSTGSSKCWPRRTKASSLTSGTQCA